FTAVAEQLIARSLVRQERSCNRREHSVSHRVSITVVDLLEVVDVDHQDAVAATLVLHVLRDAGNRLLETAPIADVHQGIGGGNSSELLVYPFELDELEGKVVLQTEDATPHRQTGAQLGGIEGLADEVVCAGFEPLHDPGRVGVRSQQKRVDVSLLSLSYPSAELRACQPRHFPIGN